MIKMMKRKMGSLLFLLMIGIVAAGLSAALSLATPAVAQVNNNKARTRMKPCIETQERAKFSTPPTLKRAYRSVTTSPVTLKGQMFRNLRRGAGEATEAD